MSIQRIWHGWTTLDNEGSYQALLLNEVIPGIEAKNIPGFNGIEVLKRPHRDEIEFITIMTFDEIQSVIEFQGPDYTRCYVPDAARKVLKRWDKHSSHYEVVEKRKYL